MVKSSDAGKGDDIYSMKMGGSDLTQHNPQRTVYFPMLRIFSYLYLHMHLQIYLDVFLALREIMYGLVLP